MFFTLYNSYFLSPLHIPHFLGQFNCIQSFLHSDFFIEEHFFSSLHQVPTTQNNYKYACEMYVYLDNTLILMSITSVKLSTTGKQGKSKQLHTNSCLPTFINFHPCLTRSKESQNNSPTNQLLSTNFHHCLSRSKESQNNSHANSCLPTFINFHPCLTRRKESQNNFHTNSCLPTLINFHLCLTRSKESQNNSHTNSCLPTLILFLIRRHVQSPTLSMYTLTYSMTQIEASMNYLLTHLTLVSLESSYYYHHFSLRLAK